MKHETGICYNCNADQALHHFETEQCPRHGIEETRIDKLSGEYYPQQWVDTTFEDSGLRKLHDAAPKLLNICIAFNKMLAEDKVDIKAKEGYGSEIAQLFRDNIEAIKKATE